MRNSLLTQRSPPGSEKGAHVRDRLFFANPLTAAVRVNYVSGLQIQLTLYLLIISKIWSLVSSAEVCTLEYWNTGPRR